MYGPANQKGDADFANRRNLGLDLNQRPREYFRTLPVLYHLSYLDKHRLSGVSRLLTLFAYNPTTKNDEMGCVGYLGVEDVPNSVAQ